VGTTGPVRVPHPNELLDRDLFAEGTWLAFGLRRRDLVVVAAVGGAAMGGVLGWVGADRLAKLSVVDRPLGGRLARYGPSRNAKFPFVLVGRARLHAALVSARTHARRDVLELGTKSGGRTLPLDGGGQRALAGVFTALRRHSAGSPRYRSAIDDLTGIAAAILEKDEGGGLK